MAPLAQLKPDDLRLAETKPSLIAVSPVVSIQSALNLMKANKITSLPVFSHDSTQIVSIVNLFDILLYLVGGSDTVEKDTFKLDDPVENVLGLDSDRESYWMHKTDSQDDLHGVIYTSSTIRAHSLTGWIRHCARLLRACIAPWWWITRPRRESHGFYPKLTSYDTSAPTRRAWRHSTFVRPSDRSALTGNRPSSASSPHNPL